MRAWLRESNGWQRLWLVFSILSLFYGVLILPFMLTKDGNLANYRYKWAVEREMRNPECLSFIKDPLEKLTEPKFTDSEGTTGCYHIYNQRQHHNKTTVPYTEDMLNKDFYNERVMDLLEIAGIGGLLALFCSAVIYGAGATIRWILRGFTSKKRS